MKRGTRLSSCLEASDASSPALLVVILPRARAWQPSTWSLCYGLLSSMPPLHHLTVQEPKTPFKAYWEAPSLTLCDLKHKDTPDAVGSHYPGSDLSGAACSGRWRQQLQQDAQWS